MEILITNDDGIHAPGINLLAKLMQNLGHVTMVAPDGPRSGQSSALTVNEPIRMYLVDQTPEMTRYVSTGTPSDCVKLAMNQLYQERRPDLVVTGINHGSNSALSVIYSGTMGAAMEGCANGILSIGFSLDDHSMQADFSHFAEHIVPLTQQILQLDVPDGICFNINAPTGPLKGVRIARQCKGYWGEEFEKRVDPHGRTYFWMTGRFINQEPEAQDTDEAFLKQGYITIVPTKIDMTDFNLLKQLDNLNSDESR